MGVLHIDCDLFTGKASPHSSPVHEQTLLLFGSADAQGSKADPNQILDIEIWDNFLAVLTDKNTLFVFDVGALSTNAQNALPDAKQTGMKQEFSLDDRLKRPIFKAVYNDATDLIS